MNGKLGVIYPDKAIENPSWKPKGTLKNENCNINFTTLPLGSTVVPYR